MSALCALLGLLFASAAGGRAADAPLTKFTIQLGSVPGSNWSPFYLAKEDGLFAKEGLDVDIIGGKTSQDAYTAVYAGSVSMAVVLALTSVINTANGQHLVAVGSYAGRNSYGLVVGEDTGIKSLRDLAGKRILVTSAVQQMLLQGLIKRAGGNPAATSYVLVPNPAGIIGSYVGKQADGMETVLPYGESVAGPQRASRYLQFSELGDAEPGYVFVVKPEMLQSQKALIAKALRAVYAAKAIVNSNDARLTEIGLKTVPGSTAAGIKRDYELFRAYQCDRAQRGKSVAYMAPKLWEDTAKIYAQFGVIEHPVDPKTLYTNEFAEGPNAVTNVKCDK